MKPRRQLVHENIVKLLTMAENVESDYPLWGAWMRSVASGLYLEQKFRDAFYRQTGPGAKRILNNLNGLSDIPVGRWEREDALRWCNETYDTHHILRFSVETMDSIEEVRVYLEERAKYGVTLLNLVGLVGNNAWYVVQHIPETSDKSEEEGYSLVEKTKPSKPKVSNP